MKKLLEATHIHHGSIRDLQTFLDQNGDPMELTPTSIEDLMRQAEERGKSRPTNSDSDERFDGPEAPGGKDNSSSSKKSDENPTGDNEGSAEGNDGEEGDDMSQDATSGQPESGSSQEDEPGDTDSEAEDGQGQGEGQGPEKPGGGKDGDGESEEDSGEQQKPQPPSGPPKMPDSQQQKPQEPPEPEFKTPEKGQMFRDVLTGKTYKWDGKKFVIQR